MNTTIRGSVKVCSIAGHTYSITSEFPSSVYTRNLTISSVVTCLLIIPAILLNGVTIVTILRSHQLKTKLCHYVVLIQSTIDLAVGLITLPLFSYIHISQATATVDCTVSYIFASIGFIPWGMSLAFLCALTFERYMCVLHPIVHRTHLTKATFLKYVSCVLLVTIILCPLAIASNIFYYIFCSVYAIIPMVLHTIGYSCIFHEIRKRLQPRNRPGDHDHDSSQTITAKERFLNDLKLAKSCALVVLTFYFCTIPGEFLNIFYLKDKFMYPVIISWYVTALGVNSSLNSIIFFWQRPSLRREAIRVLKDICK